MKWKLLMVFNAQPILSEQLLTLCWSGKEAVYKWYGLGGVDFKEHIRLRQFDQAGGLNLFPVINLQKR